MNKMTILVGIQRDGYTFQLAPPSRQLLDGRRADDAPLPDSLFLRYETGHDFISVLGQRELRWTVAEALTGLQRDQIEQIGQVEYVDPKRNFAKINPAA
ncbi:MAG: hypothetical protein OXI55_08190 [Gammaproteobacteria bacterium]|nr:hypothetical protein [Gammaproteobacteria bacterium]